MSTVLLLDRIDQAAVQRLNELSDGKFTIHHSKDSFAKPDQWLDFLSGTELAPGFAVGLRGDSKIDQTTAQLLAEKGVSLVVRFGSGVNNINVAAATKYGIVVQNVAGQNANGVAELVFGHLLTILRKLDQVAKRFALGQKLSKNDCQGREMSGKTMGVIGTGWIGSLVMQKAKALGMRVKAVENDPEKRQEAVNYVSLEKLMAECDFITVHVPLTDENLGLVSNKLIDKAAKRPIIINCAREGLVDLEAVKRGLESGLLAGYASDVDPDSDPVFTLPGTFVTPHIGAKSEESELRCAQVGAHQIFAWLTQGEVSNGINTSEMMPRKKAGQRFVIINRDVPGALHQITTFFAGPGYNIDFLANSGNKKSNLAVTVLDVAQTISPELHQGWISQLLRLEQVVRVYII